MKIFERLRKNVDTDLEKSLDELLDRATEMVRFSLDRGLASAASGAHDDATTGLSSFEQLFAASLKKMPKATREKMSLRARARLNASATERESRYGKAIASLNIDERNSVFEKAAELHSHQRIKGLAQRVRTGIEKLMENVEDEDNPDPPTGKVPASKARILAKPVRDREGNGVPGKGEKFKLLDKLRRPSLSDFLDAPAPQEFRPLELELRLTGIECIEDFKHEAGWDEISLGVVAQDIYSLPPDELLFGPEKIGEFKAGKVRKPEKLVLPRTIATIPVADGDWRNRVYTASVYLAETDWAGFNERKLEELHGLSSHEMRDILFVAYTASVFSLLGFSGGAKIGFDGKGLARAIGVGVTPALYCIAYCLVLEGLVGVAIAVGGLLALKLVAVSAKMVGDIIADAVRDEFFPPQVISFHLNLPDGIVDTSDKAPVALDMGTSFPVKPVRFEYIQTGKKMDVHKVVYELTFEWKVKAELAPAVPPDPVPIEDDPDSQQALDNLKNIDHIGVIMLENRSFDQMLAFLANDREETRLLDGKTEGMFNVLKARTNLQFENIKGGKFDTTDPEVYADLESFFKNDQIIPVLPLNDTQIEDDPNHNIVNVERQMHDRRDEFSNSILINADNPDSPGVQGDGFGIDPHWPGRLDLDLPLCTAAVGIDTGVPDEKCAMVGFVEDYFQALANRKRLHLQTLPTAGKISDEDWDKQREQLAQVMGYHPAAHVPAFDLFASEFAICDRWYSSYPGNTWVNRAFSLCGKPAKRQQVGRNDVGGKDQLEEWEKQQFHQEHGLFITNNEFPKDEESFFRYIDKTKKPDGSEVEWAFYSQDMPSLLCIDGSYASGFRNMMNGVPNRIKTIGKFFEDAEDGKLPDVFWIDPNFVDIGDLRETLGNREKNPVVQHWIAGEPGRRDRKRDKKAFGEMVLDVNTANDDHPPADISHGQHFVLEIFNALLNSPNWLRTMLIITYDEHGGFFDHRRPPYLDQLNPQIEEESPAFKSLGARVPAIVISPWVGRGLVSHQTFEHCSIIRTILLKLYETDVGISPRVLKVNHLGGLLSQGIPRFVANASSADDRSSATRSLQGKRSSVSGGNQRSLAAAGVSPRPRSEEDEQKKMSRLHSAIHGASASLRVFQGRDRMRRGGQRRPRTDLADQITAARSEVFERLFGKDSAPPPVKR